MPNCTHFLDSVSLRTADFGYLDKTNYVNDLDGNTVDIPQIKS